MTDVEEARTPEAAPNRNFFQRLGGIFLSPVETLRSIVARPSVVAPLILIILISFVTTMLVVPHIDLETTIRDQFMILSRRPS